MAQDSRKREGSVVLCQRSVCQHVRTCVASSTCPLNAFSPHAHMRSIKRQNHRKHHSHRLFFEACGPLTRVRSERRLKYYFVSSPITARFTKG